MTEPFLAPDHTTVGYEICIRYRRPTLVGEWFTVVAELLEVDGRHLLFRVEAASARSADAPGLGGALTS